MLAFEGPSKRICVDKSIIELKIDTEAGNLTFIIDGEEANSFKNDEKLKSGEKFFITANALLGFSLKFIPPIYAKLSTKTKKTVVHVEPV